MKKESSKFQSVIETKSHATLRIKRQDFVIILPTIIFFSHAQTSNVWQKRQNKKKNEENTHNRECRLLQITVEIVCALCLMRRSKYSM